jgi:hypothetical protein
MFAWPLVEPSTIARKYSIRTSAFLSLSRKRSGSRRTDIADIAGSGKRGAPNAERFPISTNQRDAI